MSIMKYTIKYLLYSLIYVVVLIAIFGIGGFIHNQCNAKETLQVSPSETDVEIPVPRLSTERSTSVGHFHADGTFHAETPQTVIGNSNRPVPKRDTTTRRAPRQNTANKSSLGWITWKYGHTGIGSRSPYYPDWTPLPQEIKDAVYLLKREQYAREWLQDEEIDLNDRHPITGLNRVESVGKTHSILDPESLLLDKKGNPLPPFTESEYAEEELRRLVGDRDIEEATQFLAQHGHYNQLLLSCLSDERAFDYLYAIGSPVNSTKIERARVYAERVVASDSDHLKARLYLADTSPRSSPSDYEAALVQYESILADHPESAHAWIEAAQVLKNLQRPFQAVSYFEKGHALGARHGHSGASTAYQQLGDYKTAWVYLKKALQVVDRSSHKAFSIVKSLHAIEAGVPRVSPLPIEKLDIAEQVPLDSFGPNTDIVFDVPSVENDVPFVLDSDLSDEEVEYQRARTEARAQAEAARREEIEMMRQMSQQEIDKFIQWAEQLMREEEAETQTTNFLAQEMAAHLTGKPAQFSPQRIVRANELIKRYGYEEGLSRIIKNDPEIAIQIQL